MSIDAEIETPNALGKAIPRFGMATLIVVLALVASASSFSATAQQQLDHKETRWVLDNLSQKIDSRIAIMQLIAKSIANDSHVHHWVNKGFAQSQESLLIDKLGFFVEEYSLTSASFADKNTHKYWNHEGFLRVLDKKIDTWYFDYLASGSQDLISVYHDKNKKRVDVYVNYQQKNGNGLSGIATSFDGIFTMLGSSTLANDGELFLVDPSGRIKIDANANAPENLLITSLYSHTLLQQTFAESEVASSNQMVSVLPTDASIVKITQLANMGWYLVYVEGFGM